MKYKSRLKTILINAFLILVIMPLMLKAEEQNVHATKVPGHQGTLMPHPLVIGKSKWQFQAIRSNEHALHNRIDLGRTYENLFGLLLPGYYNFGFSYAIMSQLSISFFIESEHRSLFLEVDYTFFQKRWNWGNLILHGNVSGGFRTRYYMEGIQRPFGGINFSALLSILQDRLLFGMGLLSTFGSNPAIGQLDAAESWASLTPVFSVWYSGNRYLRLGFEIGYNFIYRNTVFPTRFEIGFNYRESLFYFELSTLSAALRSMRMVGNFRNTFSVRNINNIYTGVGITLSIPDFKRDKS